MTRETGYLYILLATYRVESKAVPVDLTEPRADRVLRQLGALRSQHEFEVLPAKGALPRPRP